MAKITFLNHSAVLVDSGKTKILCDPWFSGLAFHDAWSLLFEDTYDLNDIDYDYIWISHEHPDHFSIPTLKKLIKPKKFLFQKTQDKKVKEYLESKGHEVIELEHKKEIFIEDIQVISIVCYGFDCSILFKFEDGTSFLNINDARVELKNHLETEILDFIKPNKLNLVASQFSYANWAGNFDDKKMPIHKQKIADNKNKYIIDTVKPEALLLFASFVYYCHEENFYWNKKSIFKHVLNELKNSQTKLILPKPNQTVDLLKLNYEDFGEKNINSNIFWESLLLKSKIKKNTVTTPIDVLEDEYEIFFQNTWNENIIDNILDNKFGLKIKLIDIDVKIEISLFKKKFTKLDKNESVDIFISTETLSFLFNNKFGRGTVVVNSRIQFDYSKAYKFFIFFLIPYQNNIGTFYNKNNPLKKSDLLEIANISALSAIFDLYPNYKKDFIDCCNNLLNS